MKNNDIEESTVTKRDESKKYPLVVESWGGDRYTLVSRGHHDLEVFKQKCREEYAHWMGCLDHPKYPQHCYHVWYKATPRDGYVAWYTPVPEGTRGAFPATVWSE